MSQDYYFENLFVKLGDETLVVSGRAKWKAVGDYLSLKAEFFEAKITDIYITNEQQGHTAIDLLYYAKLAVDILNEDSELCAYLPIKK
jgi:hypothetical protein